jgi:hypothetical protein
MSHETPSFNLPKCVAQNDPSCDDEEEYVVWWVWVWCQMSIYSLTILCYHRG